MHYFDEDIAKEYGMAEAVMFQNISFWAANNKSNERNFFGGRYWTYNSVKAFQEIFPYLSIRQIRKTLSNLENRDLLIVSGNYNKSKYDRTKWYALSDLGIEIVKGSKFHLPDLTKEKNHLHDLTNQYGDNDQPIPDIKPYNKPLYEEEAEFKKVDVISELVEVYNSLGEPFKKVTKITKGRRQKANERLKEIGSKEKFIQLIKKMDKCSFLKGNNQRGWLADFDFLIQNSEKWVKLYEGTYDDVEPKERKGKLEQYHNDPELDDFDVNEKIAEYNRTHTDQIKM